VETESSKTHSNYLNFLPETDNHASTSSTVTGRMMPNRFNEVKATMLKCNTVQQLTMQFKTLT